jgi:Protein of unknown function DUF86
LPLPSERTNFTVLAEAATQLSDEAKSRFTRIPWQQPSRLRNRIVHGYWSIDIEVLHTTASDQLPAFAAELRDALDLLTTEVDREARERQADEAGSAGDATSRDEAGPASGA